MATDCHEMICYFSNTWEALLWTQVYLFVSLVFGLWSSVCGHKIEPSFGFGSYFHHVVANRFFSQVNGAIGAAIHPCLLGGFLSEKQEVNWIRGSVLDSFTTLAH